MGLPVLNQNFGQSTHLPPTMYMPGDARGVSVTGWWAAGGASGCLAAYLPKGAASYAASLLDVSGAGRNAATGVAPTWDAVNGWSFDGATQYLTSYAVGAAPADNNLSLLVQFTNASGSACAAFGSTFLQVYPRFFGNAFLQSIGGVQYSSATIPNQAAGNLAVNENFAYLNGTTTETGTGSGSHGAATMTIGKDGTNFGALSIQAIALYNNTLSDAKIAAVAAAMAAL